MSEQYANLVSTTVGTSYVAGSGTLILASATGFPATGNFRVILDAEGLLTSAVLLKVTARSGTTCTVVAEANDASVASGKTVYMAITAGAIDAIKTDVLAQTGVLASVFIATDETTASTSFVDLTTPDSVTFTLAAASKVLVQYLANVYYTGGTGVVAVLNSVVIDGSAADDGNQSIAATAASTPYAIVTGFVSSSLGAGSHTVKIQHRVTTLTGHWRDRLLTVSITP